MAIQDDFSITRSNGNIRHTSGSTNYTVIQLHRWLQDEADDASFAGNDEIDITDQTPSERSTDNIITLINGYNIDDDAAQYLYDGSIIQDGGNIIYDGILVYANAGMYLNIIQNGALATNFWTTGLNADSANGISHRFLLKVRTGGADIDGRRLIGTTREFGYTYSEFKINGTSRGNNVIALTYATDLNNQTASGTVSGWTDITNTTVGYNGIDVNNDTVDEYFYSEWNKAGRSINDVYERMKYLTRRGESTTIYGVAGQLFRGITHEITVDNPSATDFNTTELVSWTGGATGTGAMLAINDVNAPTKMWIQILTGLPPTNNDTITGTTSGATCQMNVTITERTISQPFCGVSTGSAIIGAYGFGVEATDLSASDKVFDLNNTQYSPPNFQTGTVSGLNYTGTGDYVICGPRGYRFAYDGEASGPFTVGETLTFATPAGTAVLADLNDNGTTGFMTIGPILTGSVPTDNSTIAGSTATASVNGVVSNEIDKRQMTLNGALTGAAVTAVVVNGTIPADTPSSGTIRIKRANGIYTRHPYTSWATSTFTISSTDFSTNNAANGAQVFISYIDMVADSASESFTAVYTSARDMFIRVRNGASGYAIKTFETTASFGSGGFSVSASRIADE